MYPQLEVRDVKRILNNMGFEEQPQKGTSHVHYKKTIKRPDGSDRLLKVTVDLHNAPFSRTMVRYMAAQAGVPKKTWYQALHKKFVAPPDEDLHTVTET